MSGAPNGRQQHTKGRRGEAAHHRDDLDFTPVRNGMDFLLSAFEHLSQNDGEPDARDLKYAVLHLQAAVEVLLKARLIREHWSLVFNDPGKAKKSDYDLGSFTSCGVQAAIDRLNNIVSLDISKDQALAVRALAATRNALTHLGHTGSAFAVESQAALVLDFLITFIIDHLQPVLTSELAYVENKMEELGGELRNVKALVRERSQRLETELKPLAGRTVQCAECQQWTLVLGSREQELRCRFCLAALSPSAFAAWYAESYTSSFYDADAPHPIRACPDCNACTVVFGAVVSENRRANVDICFGCGKDYTGWVTCGPDCDCLVPPGQDTLRCPHCAGESIEQPTSAETPRPRRRPDAGGPLAFETEKTAR
ncbi:hypothetical protein [Streptomyces stelliscabiei]|uniref:hypothetical protein n=1 Tax=Streptomyces stelliscabiei TaxID=146820 RepID=UPI0029B9179B|nr:hypothetical protein [Streptomyces stelliscabiei]MDX2554742.1 hypothetical protein [Streptomyces stelliscabiei]MDX2613269.1 hypothetical protein [Streptomyces stelliscabiei]MDX2638455.1 hypothetical protein [Streptomyces stelliscabiei]MDX2661607.1 hypothetical protein [Streptomyces stelliscabiei]MDX2712260.1 hypothetical protein [Streptomyces stelliscabiei]